MNACGAFLKSGKRQGMKCGRTNCKIRGHLNIFVYLSSLLNEPAFLLLKQKSDDVFEHQKLIDIFEFSKNDFNKDEKHTYVSHIKYLHHSCEFSLRNKVGYFAIIYCLLDMKGFYEFRTSEYNKFNNVCKCKLLETFSLDVDKENIKILKNIFELDKTYFSIQKNIEHKTMIYRTLYFLKHISPIRDVEKNIFDFLVSV